MRKIIKKTQPLVIIGGETAVGELLPLIRESISIEGHYYEIVGILNDDIGLKNAEIGGVPVIGTLKDAKKNTTTKLVFAIGSHKTRALRQKIFSNLGIELPRFETIIHPTARIYPSVKVGCGSIVYPGVTLCHGVHIGSFCVITFDVIVAPDVHVGEFSMLASKSLALTGAKVGKEAFIGANSVIGEKVTIGDGSVVAMGSVVFQDVPADALIFGNPAKTIRS